MKRFGLIGHPIAHSLSPALFKAGYDGRYPYELIETSDFEEAYESFLKEYDGINVTAPFKELAFRKADILSEECQRIGATNLLIKTLGGVKAHNSDYLGVRKWLSEILDTIRKDRGNKVTVLIVGMGGAGKAAAEAARNLDCNIVLMNRTRYSEEIRPLEDFRACFREADIMIYNIPAAIPQLAELTDEDFRGHIGQDSEESVAYSRSKFILEANYKNPSFDNILIDRMKEANPDAEYISGKTWLLYQAMTGYEIFTDEKPDLAKMSDAI